MEPEANKLDQRYQPSPGIRLLWWFGIYFAAQLPLVTMAPAFWMFPVGLSFYLAPLVPTAYADSSKELIPDLGYIFYALHLALSLIFPSRRVFLILMLILTVAVVANLAGCASEMHGLSQNLH